MTAVEAATCTACPLAATRNRVVWGDNTDSPRSILLIGEAPGRYEDKEGRPFVGQAGKLLNTLLERAGLPRDDVAITNRVRCRPPENRDPTPQEREACLPWLEEEVQTTQPGVIVLLGLSAATWAHPSSKPKMAELRGTLRVLTVGGHRAISIVTYHPAAALRQGEVVERLIVADLVKARERCHV
jgi:uracil-DNA glycosylase family 4